MTPRILLPLLLLLGWASEASATITIVQNPTATQSNASSASATFGSSITAHNNYFALITWGNGSTISSVTTSIGGDTVLNRPKCTSLQENAQVYYIENSVGGSAATITVTAWADALSHKATIQLIEASGVAKSSSFDVDIPCTVAGGTNSVTSGTYSTAQASELALATGSDSNTCYNPYTAGSGFTLITIPTCSSQSFAAEYQIYTSTQTNTTASLTFTGNSSTLIFSGAVFKSASTSGINLAGPTEVSGPSKVQ